MMVSGLVTALPHHRNGRVRILGTTGTKRTSATPDIPTIAEQGLPGYEADSWTGVLAPKGTPADIVAQIHAEVVRISQLPDTRERLTAAWASKSSAVRPTHSRRSSKTTSARLGKVIRDAGIRAE